MREGTASCPLIGQLLPKQNIRLLLPSKLNSSLSNGWIRRKVTIFLYVNKLPKKTLINFFPKHRCFSVLCYLPGLEKKVTFNPVWIVKTNGGSCKKRMGSSLSPSDYNGSLWCFRRNIKSIFFPECTWRGEVKSDVSGKVYNYWRVEGMSEEVRHSVSKIGRQET